MDDSKALIIGASGGIGQALASELSRRGWQVVPVSRRADGLEVTDEASVQAVLGRIEGTFDLIVVATGVLDGDGEPPEKTLKALTPQAMAAQFAVNAIGPAMVLKHVPPLIPRDRRALVAVLTARVGSIGDNRLGGWYSYRAAKAAANQIVHSAAIELARSRKQAICVALHPGTVQTRFTRDYQAQHKTVPADEAATNLLNVMDGLQPRHTGGFYDWAGQEIPW